MQNIPNPLKPNKKINKTILLLVIAIIVISIALLLYSMGSGRKSSISFASQGNTKLFGKGQRSFSVESEDENIYNIGEYTVNLDRNRMLLLNLSVKCKDDAYDSFMDYNIIIQNAVIDTFADYSSLRSATSQKGKEQIKNDLMNNINQSLHSPIIEEVYFNRFIVQ